MGSELLKTKLYIPPSRPDLVPRPQLGERLNEGITRKLILVCAPAGFGKTTLVSNWVETINLPAAWVSLDKGDNDQTSFLIYLVAALQTVEAGICESVHAMLRDPQPPSIESILKELINELAALPQEFLLVLDDYQIIEDHAIDDALSFMLDHLPPSMHLVIISRSDPLLPLSRLRARGQMTELRTEDLRFSVDEAAEFLERVMGLVLSEDDVTALETRTEGWITGLQLAALSMRGREDLTSFVETFTGSNRYILDYLVEEVLQCQPESIQTFLLHTSVLDRLTAPLCDAVLGRATGDVQGDGEQTSAASQEMLEHLERSNLFVVPLDDERRWYRYHHLFAELLRNQLSKTQPGLRSALHRRASRWFEQEGLIPEAVHYAMASKDYDRAADLLDCIASLLLNDNRPATLLSAMASLPDETIAAHPWLCVHGAWAYFVTWQFGPIESLLKAVEMKLPDVANDRGSQAFADYDGILGRMVGLRAFMAQWQGDLARATTLSQEALAHLDEDDLQIRSVLEMNLGDICMIEGDLESARQHFEQSIEAGKAAGNYFAALASVNRLAELEAVQGCLHQAAKTYREAIRLGVEWGGGKPMPRTGRAHVDLARVLYQWNDLDKSEHHLTRGIRLGEQYGEQETMLRGYLSLARLRQVQGNAKAATSALDQAAATVPTEGRVLLADYAANWQARILLSQGNLAAASRWADSRGFAPNISEVSDFRLEESCLTLVRVRISQGRVGEAMKLLAQLLQAAETGGRMGSVIEMLLLHALALQKQGDVERALTSVEKALSLAEPEGYVRVFVDEGEPMEALLREAETRGIAPDYVPKLLAAFDTDQVQVESTSAFALIEPLSERELEVLRLLKTDLSGPEIARELVIALSTLRTHTQNIYTKLGVSNRREAVRKAEELHLQ